MAIAFPRSTRSLTADGARVALAGLTVAALLLLAWCAWFFGATLPLTVNATRAHLNLNDGETINAEFAPEQLPRIARGQRARFYPEATDTVITALVGAIDRDRSQVWLIIPPEQRQAALRLEDNASGRLEVELAQLTPAQWLFRSAGLADTSGQLGAAR